MRDIKWNADRQTDRQTAFHSYNIDYMIYILSCHTRSHVLAEWIIVHVYDLFLISFSDGNSPNWAISSCRNAIPLEKPYKITLKVSFFGMCCLWLMESVFIKLSISQEA